MRLPELLEIIGLRRERVKVGDKQLEKLGEAAVGKEKAEEIRTSLEDSPYFYGIVSVGYGGKQEPIIDLTEQVELPTQQS